MRYTSTNIVAKEKRKKVILILHNIRSVYNVGSIFRTADAAGVSVVFLSGYTPAPTDRFGRARKDIAKTALGAEQSVLWKRVSTIGSAIEQLKQDGAQVIAVEQAKKTVDYKKLSITYPVAFIFGNEVRGLSKNILGKCDVVAEIPMRGNKESLNVSVAVGIVLFNVTGR